MGREAVERRERLGTRLGTKAEHAACRAGIREMTASIDELLEVAQRKVSWRIGQPLGLARTMLRQLQELHDEWWLYAEANAPETVPAVNDASKENL